MRKRKKRKLKRLETIEGAQEITLPHLTMILDSGKLPEKLKLQGWTLEDMKELQPLLEQFSVCSRVDEELEDFFLDLTRDQDWRENTERVKAFKEKEKAREANNRAYRAVFNKLMSFYYKKELVK
ncbi:hypothetical protein [Anoxybacteroides rupiense]|jgi:hypothetical protein|uniref:hypothetical protein n=1 Tax=Anoxybacteroides rupiense TaxID=311460 RepID=UPI0016066ABB|nr:hypothetical protein [Anoxybacillus rupiensis]MBB3908481.1 hypothetical protein [Anoxybacillus rupiensis]